MKRFLLLALLALASPALAQQPTLAPSHQFFAGPSLGMVYSDACTVSGATPQTCNAMRGAVTSASLTTAALTNAAYVINNNKVLTTSVVTCVLLGYSGTIVTNGIPAIVTCVPAAGTITANITNLHGTNALSGTVTIGFSIVD